MLYHPTHQIFENTFLHETSIETVGIKMSTIIALKNYKIFDFNENADTMRTRS